MGCGMLCMVFPVVSTCKCWEKSDLETHRRRGADQISVQTELGQGLEWMEEELGQEGSENCTLNYRQAEHQGSEHTEEHVVISSQLIWRCVCVRVCYV